MASSDDLDVDSFDTTHAINRPNQIKFLRPGQMALFAKITTYPPLGRTTIVPASRKQFEFTVVIESSTSLPDQPWEVAIWYDYATCYGTYNSEWRALTLEKVATNPTVLCDNRDNELNRYTFEGSLPTPFPENNKTYKGRKVPFTVRYRINSNEEWGWVHDNFGTSDGEVILQPPIDPNFLGAGPVEVKNGWHTRKLTSEAPEARLYSLESTTTIPYDEDNAIEELRTLGKVYLAHRWFALVRIWSPWLAPRHGNGKGFRLQESAVLLSFLRTDGLHVVILAVNGIDDVLTTFKSDDEGNIVVAARNDTGKDRKFKVLAATAYSFEIANAAVMYEMRKLVRTSSAYQETAQSLPTHVRHESIESEADTILISNMHDNRNPADDNSPTPQWLASWYDSLAYCTWNSLGQNLSQEKIVEALQHFKDNDIKIANMIIDDNWQSVTGVQGVDNQFNRGMTDFEANSDAFPTGLKSGIADIRSKFPNIRDIAVWHALLGYWGCISPDTGHIKDDYKIVEVELANTPAAGKKHAIAPEDIHRFYSDFYSFLADSGITAVKTDAQFYLDLLASTKDRRSFNNTYQSAWTQAHLRHLSGKAISCMSQIPQILYHSFLPTNTPRIMLRNSDDFFPDVPSSHPWHVFANAHTALFVQHLNVLPDWDMFQTCHDFSGFHAAARCVSGGPIYITDYPGQSDISLIKQMTARNPRGDTVILRPSTIGKTVGVYDSYESGSVLKVGAYDGRSDVGTGIMGVFNVAEKEVNFCFPVTRIPGVNLNDPDSIGTNKKSWVVRSHISQRITRPMTPTLPVNRDMLLQANIPVRGYDIWSASPIHGPFDLSHRNLDVAVLGLLGKMTGACALIGSRFSLTGPATDDVGVSQKQQTIERRLRIDVQLKALGVLGIWVRVSGGEENKINLEDDLLIIMKGQVIPVDKVQLKDEVVEGDDCVLIEIDVEGSWDELGFEAGWSNEVGVEIYIS